MHLTDNFRSGDVYLQTIVVAANVIVGVGIGYNLGNVNASSTKEYYI